MTDPAGSGSAKRNRTRSIVGVAFGILAVAAAAGAIYRDRRSFSSTLHHMGIGSLLLSFGFGLIGVALTFPLWREILVGLGTRLGWIDGSGVFFTTQLGKYLPGSVWPALAQMEAGRARGASRRTMISANITTIVLNSAVGLIIACLLLPFYDASALTHYWWVLVALPVLLVALHPRALPYVLDRALALLRRPPAGERIALEAEIKASGWAVLSWLALGAHIAVLVGASQPSTFSTWVLATGAMALALPLGVLFVPAPAGAGIRDVVLVLVLGSIMKSGGALAVAIASRVLLLVADVVLGGLGALALQASNTSRSDLSARPGG